MTEAEHPSHVLTEEAIDHAFAHLATFDLLVLAVSGGPDSIALMHLVAEWHKRRGVRVPDIRVVTIDHRLRPASAEEAREVAFAALRLGLVHVTSGHDPELHGPSPGGAFSQAWARGLRYRLLQDVARERAEGGRVAIVTAHTRDDQAETVLMRLARGSGIDGLGAIRPLRQIEDAIWLARPLLGVRKVDLKSWLEARKIPWIDDPSNAVGRFERVRLRAAREGRAALGLDDAALARTAKRAQRASTALDAALFHAIGAAGAALVLSPLGYADIDRGWFDALDEELRLRLMGRLIASVGGQVGPVPLASLEDRLADFERGHEGGFTLSGAQVDARGGRVHVYREPQDARSPMAEMQLDLTRPVKWDNRFILRPVPGVSAVEVTVRALGPEGLKSIEAAGWPRNGAPGARILWGQPSLQSLNVVRWAPTLDWRAAGSGACPVEVVHDWGRLAPGAVAGFWSI